MTSRTARSDIAAIRRMLTVLTVIALFATAYVARDIFLPVVIGLLIALTLSPIVRWADQRGIPEALSGPVLVMSVVLTFGGAVALLSSQAAGWVDELPALEHKIKRKLAGVLSSVEAVKEATEKVDKLAQGETDTSGAPQAVVVDRPSFIWSTVTGATNFGASLLIGTILAIFLLGGRRTVMVRIVNVMPTLQDKKRAMHIARAIESQISRYLLSITLINALLGVFVGLWFALLGMPYPAIWGVMVFALNYLPYVGGIIGQIVVGAFALTVIDPVGTALLVPLGYFILNSLEGQLVTPIFVGRTLQLNTVSVFMAVVLWGWLWGMPGALMAVPCLVFFKGICDHIPSFAPLGVFLGQTRPLDPKETGEARAGA